MMRTGMVRLIRPTSSPRSTTCCCPRRSSTRSSRPRFPTIAIRRSTLIDCGPAATHDGSPQPPAPRVRMTSLLPNSARRRESERGHHGDEPRDSRKLQDAAGRTRSLDSLSTLRAGQAQTIQRGSQQMALNKSSDTAGSLDPEGLVVQTVTYGATQEGELVTPAIPPR